MAASIQIPKRLALLLFCYFRQGERSVDYGLSCPRSWPLLVEYYDSRLAALAELRDTLKRASALPAAASGEQPLLKKGIFAPLICLWRLVSNRYRNHWSFSTNEISVFASILERLAITVGSATPPPSDDLVALRMRCYECNRLIAQRLIGVPELHTANLIEHRFQSPWVKRFTLEELGLDN